MVNQYEAIKQILESGIIDRKKIQEELKTRFNIVASLNSISTNKSFVKRSKPLVNSDVASKHSNLVLYASERDNGSNSDPNQKNQAQAPIQDQPTQQDQGASVRIEQPKVTGSLITGKDFNLESDTASNQGEGSVMSEAYKGEFAKNQDELKPKYPIKVDRIASFTGDILDGIYRAPQIKNLTHGFEMSDKDKEMVNLDLENVIKNRVTGLDSEYGDVINSFLGIGVIFTKSVIHRIKNPKVKEELEKMVEVAEKQITEKFNEDKKLKENSVMCNNCQNAPVENDGLCGGCWIKTQIERGNQESGKTK